MPVGNCRDVARLDQSALSRAQDGWRIPKVCEDILSYRVPGSQPSVERPRKGAFLRKPQCSIESHPAHQTRVQEFSRPATNLPYALIGPLPVLSQPLQYPLNFLPPGIGHWVPVLVRQIDGIHHFAINIQLQLLVGRITDTHGPRMFEPLQMIKRPLIELLPAVNPVHHL